MKIILSFSALKIRSSLILVDLMSGGDYEDGSKRSGIATARNIARHGLDNALFDAAHHISRERPISFGDKNSGLSSG